MSAGAPVRPEGLNYGLDETPKPLPKAVGLGIQHVLTMFGATIAVPFIIGGALGFQGAELAVLISSVFIASGVATAVQVAIGSRLPIVQGVSFAFLGPFFAIAATYQGAEGMQVIAGMVIVGALMPLILGYGGLMGVLRRFITPITIGPVIALVGLSLFGAAADNSGQHWPLALTTLGLIFLFALALAPRVRLFSLFPILLAVLAAYLIALVSTALGVFEEGSAAAVSFAAVADAPAFRGFEVGGGGLIFPWGTPIFDFTFIVAILAAYLASSIESFGDYHAISRIAGVGDPDARTINRGIGAEGIGCALTGVFGGFSSTSYSENIGLVGLTRVASRSVVLIGAGVLVVLGLIGPIGAIIATIPIPVVGGVYLALFGLITAVGLSNLRRADMDSQRNLMIVGFLLFGGLAFPAYFGSEAAADFSFFGIGWATTFVASIGSNAIAVAAVLGILLDNLIPGTPEERGIVTNPLGSHRRDGARSRSRR
ncbi:uracil-xanthine permease family protein [Egicoccus halophilus]|uniref:Xanthine permease n=1 Tax=Egicoccus halophilus TaxID=1670830 RepID=A0A8J3ER59_9ACTN|nr:solute carrier family 23 protein [Egicoccus halophilus]GGI04238.1 xanthine permease [Egicoccus halophilus]